MTPYRQRKIPRCSRCGSKEHNKRKCTHVWPASPDVDALNRIVDAHGRAIDALNITCSTLLAEVRLLATQVQSADGEKR